eukprot:1532856-Pyramimonas_sp.AAC.1
MSSFLGGVSHFPMRARKVSPLTAQCCLELVCPLLVPALPPLLPPFHLGLRSGGVWPWSLGCCFCSRARFAGRLRE